MALSEGRLKGKIKAAMDAEALQENNPDQSRERFATALAKAIIEEIKEVKITYTSGLSSATGGPVAGNFTYTLT